MIEIILNFYCVFLSFFEQTKRTNHKYRAQRWFHHLCVINMMSVFFLKIQLWIYLYFFSTCNNLFVDNFQSNDELSFCSQKTKEPNRRDAKSESICLQFVRVCLYTCVYTCTCTQIQLLAVATPWLTSSSGCCYSWASLLHISVIINKLTHACKVRVKY